jgi:hypothetical protein
MVSEAARAIEAKFLKAPTPLLEPRPCFSRFNAATAARFPFKVDLSLVGNTLDDGDGEI